MADIFASAVVSIIFDNINSLVSEELGITGRMKTELERLQSNLSSIKAVLSDAEMKQMQTEAIKDWLKKLKHTAYEAENILDDIAANTRRGIKVSHFFRLPKRVLFRLKMVHKLKDVREKLDNIARERSDFHLSERVEAVEDREVSDGKWRETSSLVNESEVFGRDKEREKAIGMVLKNSVDPVFVYSICGMGGIGKTTLAQLIYNNQSIKEAFDLRIWVCVSNDFNIKRLTKDIIESISENCSLQQLDPLQRDLQEKLEGKRFLLVLDDVWNENPIQWQRLKKAFTCGGKGSTVVVTTRSQKVANMMATAPTHVQHLGCLSPDDSWSLFKQCAFHMGKSEDYPHLEAHGMEIVKKCAGAPLAIKILGDLLRSKETERDWLSIKESMMWEIEEEEEGSQILEVLKLSYNHLKPHLKQCFSFCSLFPKDFVMVKEELIQLWMANGFIPSEGQRNLHDKGLEIFNELVQRSFFQELDVHAYGTCKMHDLIHDLAQSIMSCECCTIQSEQQELVVPQTVRHLLITGNYNKADAYVSCVQNLLEASSLRSMIGWYDFIGTQYNPRKLELELDYNRIVAKQKYLRVVELGGNTSIMKISSFTHLRYLRVFDFEGNTLPDSICNLYNLQTLKLIRCWELQSLPEGMMCLKNLIYLDFKDCHSITFTPPGLGQLSSLRLLSKFVVGKNQGFFIEELKELKLEGELDIRELHNVECSEDARSANLKMKPDLRILKLCWGKDSECNLEAYVEEVLDGLQPHSNLKELTIWNYQGRKFPNWLMVSNLVELLLKGCERCECLPPLGKLPSLKILNIRGMKALKCIDYSFYGDGDGSFPSLERLSIVDMPCLEVWETVNGNENFPLLSELTIYRCPKLKNIDIIQHLSALRYLWIWICEGLTCLPNRIQNLELLSDFRIGGCPNITRLPQGMRNLTALRYLVILNCPHLERRCETDTGEDWPIIAHIPRISIES